jgi:hypothetical protein
VALAEARGEFCDSGCWVLCGALQDVDEIRVDIEPVQPTGHDEGVDDADVLRSESVQKKVQFLRPIGMTLRARSRWFVSRNVGI